MCVCVCVCVACLISCYLYFMAQLRRLQGKRERRVQEIDIIDIHGEQVQCDASMLLKNITEEKTHMPKRVCPNRHIIDSFLSNVE